MKNVSKNLDVKGQMAVVMEPRDNISIYVWHDSKTVFGITNAHPHIELKCQRQQKGLADKVEYPCPLMFAEYNRNMGAVDDFDRLMSSHSCQLRSSKWWHAFFYFLIDVAAINALHLWRFENPTEAELTTRRVWIAGLIEEILEKYGTAGGKEVPADPASSEEEELPCHPTGKSGKSGGSHYGLARASDVLAGTKRLSERHFMEKGERRGNCALCFNTKPCKEGEKPVWFKCKQCNVMLHHPSCFNAWHTAKKPRSELV